MGVVKEALGEYEHQATNTRGSHWEHLGLCIEAPECMRACSALELTLAGVTNIKLGRIVIFAPLRLLRTETMMTSNSSHQPG